MDALTADTVGFDREAAVLKILPRIKQIAQQIAATHPPCITVDDLYNEGCLAAVESANRFQPGRGIDFIGFAYKRIHGAMISLFRDQSLYKETSYWGTSEDSVSVLDTYADPATLPNTTNCVLGDVWSLVDQLNPRERDIMKMFYQEGQRQQTIGEKYGLTNSRVCQILSRAVEQIRLQMGLVLDTPAVEPEETIPSSWDAWLSRRVQKPVRKRFRFHGRRRARKVPYVLCLMPAVSVTKTKGYGNSAHTTNKATSRMPYVLGLSQRRSSSRV